MLRTVIAYVLLVALLEGQRSSSESLPFDNPFWVEWLREQRRSGRPTATSAVAANEGTLQPISNSHIFGDLSTKTVPLLQPLFPRGKLSNIEKGKVTSPTLKTRLNNVNEHDSDGQSLGQSTLRKVLPIINGKSASIPNSFRPNNHILSASDAQSDIFKNQFFEGNNDQPYFEENRSSLNRLPIAILNSNEFGWSNKPNVQPLLSSFPNGDVEGQVFVVDGDDGIREDELKYNLITSTIEPILRATEEKIKGDENIEPNKVNFFQTQRHEEGTDLTFTGESLHKDIHDGVFLNSASFVPITGASSIVPVTTSTSTTSSTTETSTYSTTTRTLVASWPVIRSRNIGASRAANRFRSRVPLSSSRKSVRRNKFTGKRRQVFKRRRQTITPQIKSTTTSIPVIITTSVTPSIFQNVDPIKIRVSRTPNSSTTTITTTTTNVKVTSSGSVKSTTSTTTTSTHQTSTSTTPPPTVAATTSAATFVYTNLRTASALVVTRNVTSTRVVTAPIPAVIEDEEEATFATTTEMTSTDREEFSTTDAPIKKENVQEDDVQYFPIQAEIENNPTTMSSKYNNLEDTIVQAEEIVDYEPIDDEENFIPMPSNINNVKVEDPGVRSPRLTDWDPPQSSGQIRGILSGEYHEMNPGQYHEMNPGQYHESNPGQYHEINPGQPVALVEGQEIQAGQYHEVSPGQPVALVKEGHEIHAGQYHEINPGQYHEVNPGQYHEVNPGQYLGSDNSELKAELVGVEHTDNAKIYNVQQRVNEFIIGEYGTISNSGQTLQGVRYTAIDDDQSGVDPNLIYETLVKYFPMAAAKFAESNSNAAS